MTEIIGKRFCDYPAISENLKNRLTCPSNLFKTFHENLNCRNCPKVNGFSRAVSPRTETVDLVIGDGEARARAWQAKRNANHSRRFEY